ncbi:uncharacterized protein LOC142879757 [Nelusetta ayraudi]|uniref:uncharacterized protein LOC142879757 n=1 Tax=Nelusetta ayraudi TaxID=303726 RepID=UPI003F6EBC00
MRSCHLFLLLYLTWCCCGTSSATSHEPCGPGGKCVPVPDATSHFLQCVGLPPTDTGRDHMRRLKEMLEGAMDLYTFMKSSVTGVPFLSLQGALELNPQVDPLHYEPLVQMWLEIKIKPLLKSITKGFLSCLSTKTFSCSTYQTVVRELSRHFSGMNPVRQKWIYSFFMYPFLSGPDVAGCVERRNNSEDWLVKNFGAFKAMARMKDFSSLNMDFSGLEVLDLLSPAQKAELLLSPEVASLGNGTLSLVFHNLLTGSSGPRPTAASPGACRPSATRGHRPPDGPQSSCEPHRPPPQNNIGEIVNGFMMALQPVGSFVHEFVAFTHERDVSQIRSTTLTQFLLNWTVAELADMYRPKNTSVAVGRPTFDVTKVEDWYQQVVMPLLQSFLPANEFLTHPNITMAFHQVFYLDHDMDHGLDNDTTDIIDVCSITLDKGPCGLTDTVVHVADILHCAARTNLTMSERTITRVIVELTERLNSLVRELAKANFSEVAADFREIFSGEESPSLTQEHLNDPEFIEMWFKVKLMPLLPNVPVELLSCLSTKNFSCPVYQTIVKELSHRMSQMDLHPMYSHNIYTHFVYSFLRHHNTSDPQCVSTANSSSQWLKENFGFFSRFASVLDFYKLHRNFSGLEVLPLLTPKQLAEMLLLPLPTPPEKHVVIDSVMDFLLESPRDGKLIQVLYHLIQLVEEVSPPCGVYKQILERLYGALQALPPSVESAVWPRLDELIHIIPEECLPANITCPATQYNASYICSNVDSSDLQSHSAAAMYTSCNVTLESYACAQLENFTVDQLVSLLQCDLPGNSSHSIVLWKMLLTKLSFILDPALDALAVTPNATAGPSASEILDVIGEIRVSLLTDEQLMNSSLVHTWFSERLRLFLPSASGRFLSCLGRRNLSCHSYRQILQAFVRHYEEMSSRQQNMVLRDFILRFLSHSGAACVDNSSAEFLQKNLGVFSRLLSVRELLTLNPQFRPLEVLHLLTPRQLAELLVLTGPSLQDKELIINMIFDRLTASPNKTDIPDFLSNLIVFLKMGNFSCSSFKTLFNRIDLILPTVPINVASSIRYIKTVLSGHIPAGCIIYASQCTVTVTNETQICSGVNSSAVQRYLDGGQTNGDACDFAVEEFTCASLSGLAANTLADFLACNRSMNTSSTPPVWKLLLSKASSVLDGALDLLSNRSLDSTNPAVSMILEAILEVRLDSFTTNDFNNPAVVQLWFNHRLLPFLPSVSTDFLSCLTRRGLNCSTYQQLVQILSHVKPNMSHPTQMLVIRDFIKVFLTRSNTTDPSCSLDTGNGGQWLQKNLGAFAHLLSFQEIWTLNGNFSAMAALPLLTVRQLAGLSSTPRMLTSAAQVNRVMDHVPDQQLAAFFDDFSPAVQGKQSQLHPPVIPAMLQVVFDRANLSRHSVDDAAVTVWLHNRLGPLLFNLSQNHVAPFFRIVAGRNCSVQQLGVEDLNSTMTSLSEAAKTDIHNHIIQNLKGPIPLQCYGDNANHSFYRFLEASFLGFQFPNLTTFLSLIPHNRTHQLLNSMAQSDVGSFLRRPNVVDSDTELCVMYDNYDQTPQFLETERLPAAVRRPTLPCVWPTALGSSGPSEANKWFDQRLPTYLAFLNKDLISPASTYNASCFAFQKLVSTLGPYNYSAVDFVRQDVFDAIRTYLASASRPRCYNQSNPELNSTAWFAEYIGPFMPFLTLELFQSFGSAQFLQVFTVNPENIALLNHSILPVNLTNYYTELIYQQDSNFNPLLLPLLCRCVAPGPAFTQLTPQQSMIVLYNLTTLCSDLDPQVSAALAGNFGDTIDSTTISALGNESTALSTGQLSSIRPQDLLAVLSMMGSLTGWNLGQANAVIGVLLSSGIMQINNSSTLLMLGSLVIGVPARTFVGISGTQLLAASKDPSFVGNILTASQVVQQTVVVQITSLNSNSDAVVDNIPDQLATEIPRTLLLSLSSQVAVLKKVNKKKWRRQQVELFFERIAVDSATATLGGAANLSSSVLQGFTCIAVRSFSSVQIRKLVRACRRRGRNKVRLVETQLTCMYNHISSDADVTSFHLFPPDVLLYYDYSLVNQSSCRSYFEQLASADFSVFSAALSYKQAELFANARSCLGITTKNLTADNVSVLGNMCCTLDSSYIQFSNSSILEVLSGCSDLTVDQAAAVEALLVRGQTQHGAPSTWSEQTLRDLGMLPLYLSSTFYDHFDKKTKRTFLRYFLEVLRKDGVSRRKRRSMKRAIRESIRRKTKRSTVNECTIGIIEQVTIHDETFPFDYDDVNQFDYCLNATIVKVNLAAIVAKVDQEEFQSVVLRKLREAYAADSTIPESQVQLLGPVSRTASISDVHLWTITQVDTFAALMNSDDGPWDPSLAKAIVTKYLNTTGNTLGTTELNTVGGDNLCSLDLDKIQNISHQSLRRANALNVSNCTPDRKRALFTIAQQAFTSTRVARTTTPQPVTANSYQLSRSYIGGADAAYVKQLVNSNVNMDLDTFTSLNESVVLALNVSEVESLLGTNVAGLKSYENDSLVRSWIQLQPQSELDRLSLGLTGGTRNTTSGNTTAAPDPTSGTDTAATVAPTADAGATGATDGGATATATSAAPDTGTNTNPNPSSATDAATTAAPDTGTNTNTNTTPTGATDGSATDAATTAAATTTATAATTGSNSGRIQVDVSVSFLMLVALLIHSQHNLV